MTEAEQIRQSVEGAIKFYTEHPEKAVSTDKAAQVSWQGGLRFRAEGTNGAVFLSDMPKGVGGGQSAPTPGWFMRAGVASCTASVIATRLVVSLIAASDLWVRRKGRRPRAGVSGLGRIPMGATDTASDIVRPSRARSRAKRSRAGARRAHETSEGL